MKEFDKAFEKYDVILTPTSPTVAFDIGSKSDNPLEMYLADICTVSVNIAGLPGISIPVGVDKQGMPIGMQLIGNRFQEETILNVAYVMEQKLKFRENYKKWDSWDRQKMSHKTCRKMSNNETTKNDRKSQKIWDIFRLSQLSQRRKK